jgi:hypothetical protein
VVRIRPHRVILRHILNMINSFLCSFANDLDNRLLFNDLIVIRNQGVDQVGHLEHQDGDGKPRRLLIKVEVQSNSEFIVTSHYRKTGNTPDIFLGT